MGEPICVTLENPWLDNQRNISCIPEGVYQVKQVDSPHFGDTFEVVGVDGRTNILFHKGNVSTDTKGCLILGSSYGSLGGKPAVLASKAAFEMFHKKASQTGPFFLTISNAEG